MPKQSIRATGRGSCASRCSSPMASVSLPTRISRSSRSVRARPRRRWRASRASAASRRRCITTSLHPGQDSTPTSIICSGCGPALGAQRRYRLARFHGDASAVASRCRLIRSVANAIGSTRSARRSNGRRRRIADIRSRRSRNDAMPSPSTPDASVMTNNRSAALLSRLQALFADLSGVDAQVCAPIRTSSRSASIHCS